MFGSKKVKGGVVGFILTMRNVNCNLSLSLGPATVSFILTMRNVNAEQVVAIWKDRSVLY